MTSATLSRFSTAFHLFLDLLFQFVDLLADFALCIFGSRLQPQVVYLREHAVLARHPAIAEGFPGRIRS